MAPRRPCQSMFALFYMTELSDTVYVMGGFVCGGVGGRAPDFCKKLIKAWFNGGGITTRPLVLQRERPGTAGGTLVLSQLCAAHHYRESPKSLGKVWSRLLEPPR